MKGERWYTVLNLILAGWFALTAWIWVWLANLFLSYPFGLLALVLYFVGKKHAPESRLNRIALFLLIGGFAVSIAVISVYAVTKS